MINIELSEVTINLATEQIRYYHWGSRVGNRGMILIIFLIFIEKIKEIAVRGVVLT